MTCEGVAEYVIAGGRVAVENGVLLDVPQGAGRFVPTPPNAPYVYMKVQEREKVCMRLGKPLSNCTVV